MEQCRNLAASWQPLGVVVAVKRAIKILQPSQLQLHQGFPICSLEVWEHGPGPWHGIVLRMTKAQPILGIGAMNPVVGTDSWCHSSKAGKVGSHEASSAWLQIGLQAATNWLCVPQSSQRLGSGTTSLGQGASISVSCRMLLKLLRLCSRQRIPRTAP